MLKACRGCLHDHCHDIKGFKPAAISKKFVIFFTSVHPLTVPVPSRGKNNLGNVFPAYFEESQNHLG